MKFTPHPRPSQPAAVGTVFSTSAVGDAPATSGAAHPDVVFVFGGADRRTRHLLETTAAQSGVKFRSWSSFEELRSERQVLGESTIIVMVGHGGNNDDEGHHYFRLGDQTVRTDRLIAALRGMEPQPEEMQEGEPGPALWKGLVIAGACQIGHLRDQIRPDDPLWANGTCLFMGSTKDVATERHDEELAELVRYVGACKKAEHPLSTNEMAAKVFNTTGDCTTMLGGPLHEPVVVHPVKTPEDLTRGAAGAAGMAIEHHPSRVRGNEEDLRSLLDALSSATEADRKRQLLNALFVRCKRGTPEEVEALLRFDPTIVHARDGDGNTLLHQAAVLNPVVAEKLIEFGADASAVNRRNETPLHHAAKENQAGAVALLLKAGARLDHLAAAGSPLQVACSHGSFAVAKALVQAGADPTQLTADGRTLLHLACQAGDYDTVAWLVNDLKLPKNAEAGPMKMTPLQVLQFLYKGRQEDLPRIKQLLEPESRL